MSTKTLIFIVTLASILFGVWAYALLPEQVASHWNAAGEADGYMSRFWGAFLLPLVNVGIALLYLLIPKIELRKEHLESFRPAFELFILGIMLFMVYMFGLTLRWNLIEEFDFTVWMVPGFAALMWLIGDLVAQAKSNWFVGIRTPWTLSNDEVWNKTHALGAKLFKGAAIISLAAMFVPEYSFWFVIGTVLVAAFIPIVYSYTEYQKAVPDKKT